MNALIRGIFLAAGMFVLASNLVAAEDKGSKRRLPESFEEQNEGRRQRPRAVVAVAANEAAAAAGHNAQGPAAAPVASSLAAPSVAASGVTNQVSRPSASAQRPGQLIAPSELPAPISRVLALLRLRRHYLDTPLARNSSATLRRYLLVNVFATLSLAQGSVKAMINISDDELAVLQDWLRRQPLNDLQRSTLTGISQEAFPRFLQDINDHFLMLSHQKKALVERQAVGELSAAEEVTLTQISEGLSSMSMLMRAFVVLGDALRTAGF